MSSVRSVTKAPAPEVAEQLLQVANEVALNYAQNYDWSTWHSWDAVNPDEDQPHTYSLDRSFWSLTGQSGTSLGASTHIMMDLEATLRSHPAVELQQYAQNVQLMTSTQYATAETEYHAVVAMCFNYFAIIIDHTQHHTAFRVPLGGAFNMVPQIPVFGPEGQACFKYQLEDNEHKLIMDDEQASYAARYFSEMDIDSATSQIAAPATQEMQPVKGLEKALVPRSKYLSVRSLFDEKPQLLASSPLNGKWLATAVRIQVDFAQPQITIQVPMADWLQKPEQAVWHDRLFNDAHEGLQVSVTNALVRLELKIHAVDHVQPYYELSGLLLMQAIGEQFGLDYAVLNAMMWSVYRVWAPYGSKSEDFVVKDEMSVSSTVDVYTCHAGTW